MSDTESRLCAIVVIHQTHPCHSLSIRSLKDQIDKSMAKFPLLVYDNTPNPAWTETDLVPLREFFDLKYISDRTNPGIAKAYNCALDLASGKGIPWLLILDQDTELPPYFLKNTLELVEANRVMRDIVLFVPSVNCQDKYISPSKRSLARIKRLRKPLPAGAFLTKRYTAINSGMILNTDFMQSIGKYSEKYTLDYLDHWLMATVYKYRKKFYLTGILIKHHLSEMEILDFHTSLTRHKGQLISVLDYYREYGSTFEYLLAWCFCFFRCLKLSFRYKNLAFLLNLRFPHS